MKPIKNKDFCAWIDHLIEWMCTTTTVSQLELFRQTGMSQPTLSNYRRDFRETGKLFGCQIPRLKLIAAAHDKIERKAALAGIKAMPKTTTPEPRKEPIDHGRELPKRRRRRRSRIAGNHAP